MVDRFTLAALEWSAVALATATGLLAIQTMDTLAIVVMAAAALVAALLRGIADSRLAGRVADARIAALRVVREPGRNNGGAA